MRYLIRILVIFMVFTCLTAEAVPSRKGIVMLCQPDGTTFPALIRGDEFIRIKTTLEGHSIVQDTEGWWCYAIYDQYGNKKGSGWKVGCDAPSDILSASRNIPYVLLSQAADERRNISRYDSSGPILKRMMEMRGIATRTTGETGNEESETVTKHGLVILASFNDVEFEYTKEDFCRLLTEEGYSENGATGSAKEYFDDQFNGNIQFDFHVSEVVRLPRNRAYYGTNGDDGTDKFPAHMIEDACIAADDEIDFSLFDDDNDGVVDNVFLFFAGADEAEGASEDCIWSHSWYIQSGAGIDLVLDGKQINRYACSAELKTRHDSEGKIKVSMAGIGTFCHEYSHTFGLPDFYDTDYEKEGNLSAGLWGSTSLMDSGNYNNDSNTPPYFNAIERWLLGVEEPKVLTETGAYSMSPINEGNGFYLMETDTPDEFYLFECRAEEGWDRYIKGSGMLVYHIDRTEDVKNSWLYTNDLNSSADHQCADLIEADGRADGFTTMEDYKVASKTINSIFFPYDDVNSLTGDSTPALKFWSGAKSPMSITGITKDGKDIRFNFIASQDAVGPPTPSNFIVDAFADAAIIRFESSYEYEGEATVRWGRTGYENETAIVEPYAPGKYSLTLEDLEHTGKTYSASISFTLNEMEGEVRKISFMTKRMPSVKWPYIYLGSIDRMEDGTFPEGSRLPLRVYGATGAEEIIWYFDGKEISHDGDGYYTIPQSGTIKAVIYWEDGSTDIVTKDLTLSK